MNNTVNSGITTDGQSALDRVGAALEAVTGKKINFVNCGNYKTASDGTLVPVTESTFDMLDEPEIDFEDDGSDEVFDSYVRPVVRPLVLTAVAALEQARAHVEKVLGDSTGGLMADELQGADARNFVWLSQHEMDGLDRFIKHLSYAADGMIALECLLYRDVQELAQAEAV